VIRFCKRWAPFFQIKQRWAPFLSVFSGSLPRFSRMLQRFSQILPGFSTNRNFLGCAFTPASYTTVWKTCRKCKCLYAVEECTTLHALQKHFKCKSISNNVCFFVFVRVWRFVTKVVESDSQGVGGFWLESDSQDQSESDLLSDSVSGSTIESFLHHTPKLGIPVQMVQF